MEREKETSSSETNEQMSSESIDSHMQDVGKGNQVEPVYIVPDDDDMFFAIRPQPTNPSLNIKLELMNSELASGKRKVAEDALMKQADDSPSSPPHKLSKLKIREGCAISVFNKIDCVAEEEELNNVLVREVVLGSADLCQKADLMLVNSAGLLEDLEHKLVMSENEVQSKEHAIRTMQLDMVNRIEKVRQDVEGKWKAEFERVKSELEQAKSDVAWEKAVKNEFRDYMFLKTNIDHFNLIQSLVTSKKIAPKDGLCQRFQWPVPSPKYIPTVTQPVDWASTTALVLPPPPPPRARPSIICASSPPHIPRLQGAHAYPSESKAKQVSATIVRPDYGRYLNLSETRSASMSYIPPSFTRIAPKKRVDVGDMKLRQSVPSQRTLIMRPRDSKGSKDDDVEILEEEAVCKLCFAKLNSNDITLMTSCGCGSVLIHENCVGSWCKAVFEFNDRCDTCRQGVQKQPVILINSSIPDKSESSERSWFSWLKR